MATRSDTDEVFNQPPPYDDVDLFVSDAPLREAMRQTGRACGRLAGILNPRIGAAIVPQFTAAHAVVFAVCDITPSAELEHRVHRSVTHPTPPQSSRGQVVQC